MRRFSEQVNRFPNVRVRFLRGTCMFPSSKALHLVYFVFRKTSLFFYMFPRQVSSFSTRKSILLSVSNFLPFQYIYLSSVKCTVFSQIFICLLKFTEISGKWGCILTTVFMTSIKIYSIFTKTNESFAGYIILAQQCFCF